MINRRHCNEALPKRNLNIFLLSLSFLRMGDLNHLSHFLSKILRHDAIKRGLCISEGLLRKILMPSCFCNEQTEPSHSKLRRWKSVLIHEQTKGGLLSYILNTNSIHKVSSLKFEYNKHSMPLLHFTREAIPSHYFPLREDLFRVLAWGLHG